MTTPLFDLGLDEADERAMQQARRRPVALDRDTALLLIRDATKLVADSVQKRPLLSGEPFRLPGHREHS